MLFYYNKSTIYFLIIIIKQVFIIINHQLNHFKPAVDTTLPKIIGHIVIAQICAVVIENIVSKAAEAIFCP
jgi:hypothetical protein